MMKCIGPEFDWKVHTKKHHTDSIGNIAMTTFHRTVLDGSISTSHMNVVLEAGEQLRSIRIVTRFSSLIKKNLLSRICWIVFLEDMW